MSDMSMVSKPSQVISRTIVINEYDLYLHGEISHDADEYLEHFAVYHAAGPDDLVRLWIQSPGGSVAVGHQYIKHMQRCQGTIHAVIGMGTASEATAICLAAHDWEVDEMSTFLVHGFSYGTYGHEAQVYNTAAFNKKLNERSLRNTYSGFLNEQEILEALKGVDLLFDGDELMERLQSFKEYRASQPCNCGQADCPKNAQLEALAEAEDEEDFDEMPSLSEIIADAVELGVKKALAARDAAEKKASRPKALPKEVKMAQKKVEEIKAEILQ